MRPELFSPITLPLARILEDRTFNIRIFYGDIDELAVQLMTEGLREPILVRESAGQYYVVDGHRRQRALARTLQLRIAAEDGKFIVYDGGQPLRDGPGPVHPDFDPRQVPCRLADPAATLEELFTSRLLGHRGKPFTLLERQVFLSRALRQGGRTTESLALKAGFSPAEIAGARQLNAADPRLLDQVRDGRISSQLVLRLLRTVPPPEQIVRLKVARAAADRDHREKLMARDFEWAESDEASAEEPIEVTADPVHARLHELVARLGDTVRFAPNPASEERLGTLLMIHRYALGKIAYERLEAHLLGRQ